MFCSKQAKLKIQEFNGKAAMMKMIIVDDADQFLSCPSDLMPDKKMPTERWAYTKGKNYRFRLL